MAFNGESNWHLSWIRAMVDTSTNWGSVGKLTEDTMRLVLFKNTVANPDPGAGQQVTYGLLYHPADQVSSAPGWPYGGAPVTRRTLTQDGPVVRLAGDPVVSAGPVTMDKIRGALVYDDTTQLKWGVAYYDYGAEIAVAGGLFAVIWHPDGMGMFDVALTPA